jgi:lambda repressor-like predicted transcriptional regulator
MELLSTQEFMLDVVAKLTRAGLKMKDLSKETGIAETTLSDAKNRRTMFTFERANVIKEALNKMVDK